MKVFKCILSDNDGSLERRFFAKENLRKLKESLTDCTLEKVEDVTGQFPIDIPFLAETLHMRQYGQSETALICALVEEHNLTLKGAKKNGRTD